MAGQAKVEPAPYNEWLYVHSLPSHLTRIRTDIISRHYRGMLDIQRLFDRSMHRFESSTVLFNRIDRPMYRKTKYGMTPIAPKYVLCHLSFADGSLCNEISDCSYLDKWDDAIGQNIAFSRTLRLWIKSSTP